MSSPDSPHEAPQIFSEPQHLSATSAFRLPPSDFVRRLFLTGPTASGKGAAAHLVARALGGEVVAVDSMKIYREMNVGTAKPSPSRRAEVPYHLMDLVDPDQEFSVGEYLPLALRKVEEIEARGRTAVLCGGTALYLNALVNGLASAPPADWRLREALLTECVKRGPSALHARLKEGDPAAAAKINPHDERRIIRALEVLETAGKPLTEVWRGPSPLLTPGSYVLVGIAWDRPALYRRIDQRVLRMAGDGLFEEARGLSRRPRGLSRAAAQCIGYKEILAGEGQGAPREEIIAAIQQGTRRFAKQQVTWFRRFPIAWIPADDSASAESIADAILKEFRSSSASG
jgi:tRNA dimethylallyltransferase